MSTYEEMDRMYRFQRYFYDLTRAYYLLGRDMLIDQLTVRSGDNVLEIGCGTGRNLAILAAQNPGANFYGLDASAEMLVTAESKLRKKGITNVDIKKGLAEEFDFGRTFGLEQPFDSIFFSYSISMIPAWREAFQNALDNLKKRRSIHIVDFCDQRELPAWFGKALRFWLRQFRVRNPVGFRSFVEQLESGGVGKHEFAPIYRGYSFVFRFDKN